jgi:hypothetical protein
MFPPKKSILACDENETADPVSSTTGVLNRLNELYALKIALLH